MNGENIDEENLSQNYSNEQNEPFKQWSDVGVAYDAKHLLDVGAIRGLFGDVRKAQIKHGVKRKRSSLHRGAPFARF